MLTSLAFRIAVYACAALFIPTAIFSGFKVAKVWQLNRDNTKLAEALDANKALLATALDLNAKWKKANEDLVLANTAENKARKALQEALKEAVEKNKQVSAAADKAARDKARADAERDRALSELKNTRALIYATDQDCSNWGRSLVCGPVSDSLRIRWGEAQRAADNDPVARDGGSGNDALRADPHRSDGQARFASATTTVHR